MRPRRPRLLSAQDSRSGRAAAMWSHCALDQPRRISSIRAGAAHRRPALRTKETCGRNSSPRPRRPRVRPKYEGRGDLRPKRSGTWCRRRARAHTSNHRPEQAPRASGLGKWSTPGDAQEDIAPVWENMVRELREKRLKLGHLRVEADATGGRRRRSDSPARLKRIGSRAAEKKLVARPPPTDGRARRGGSRKSACSRPPETFRTVPPGSGAKAMAARLKAPRAAKSYRRSSRGARSSRRGEALRLARRRQRRERPRDPRSRRGG